MNNELVYDVGAHHGSDTAHYLFLGYKVLAIEADPKIAAGLRERFAHSIATDRLTVLNCGIAEADGELPFYVCPENTEWNSFRKGWAESRGATSQEVRVPARRFETVLEEYGVPTFLKVDIEGLDSLCIRALGTARLPQFVSLEAAADDLDLIVHLRAIGYQRFSLIDQHSFCPVAIPPIGTVQHVRWSSVQAARRFVRAHPALKRATSALRPAPRFDDKDGFRNDSAGPTPMERQRGWQTLEEFARTWIAVVASGLLTSSWYDIHAAL